MTVPTLALVLALAADSGSTWLGRDKVKHFVLSAFIHSVAFSVTRRTAGRGAAQVVSAGAVVAAGVSKELLDRRAGRPFSPADLAWGLAGGAAAASLLNGTR
jgi:uncharacterized protein YfiM (DUF2279 family)